VPMKAATMAPASSTALRVRTAVAGGPAAKTTRPAYLAPTVVPPAAAGMAGMTYHASTIHAAACAAEVIFKGLRFTAMEPATKG